MPAPSQLKKLEAAAAEADKRYGAAAAKLSAARSKSADKLNKAVNAELAPLKLERAKFMTQVESDANAPGPQGIDRVEFWVQTNPGTRPGPMMKVASGGELSRFLLALKVVLADRGSAPTLVFDEIDTGVGGAVADAIGARLARLAGKVQVMAVTHAPQVAARANQHLLISKDALDKGKRVATRVNALAADHRREEIARMLAGAEITAEARAAAERLLQAASCNSSRARVPGDFASGFFVVFNPKMARKQNQNPCPTSPSSPRPQAKVEHMRLSLEIEAHNERYYQKDAPNVSDAAYDALRQRLEAIEAKISRSRHPGFADAEGRRRTGARVCQSAARSSDAVARQRLQRRGCHRVRRSHPALSQARCRDICRRWSPSRRSTACRCRCATRTANWCAPRRAATVLPARTSPPTSAPSRTFRTR